MSIETVYDGKYLRLLRRGRWVYADRPGVHAIVAIVAVTNGALLLIEQHRPPVDRRVIELPAGLVGDTPGDEDEDIAAAARRELLEETGYVADEMTVLTEAVPSAGLASEVVTLLRATGLRKTAGGGGVDGEEITVHLVPLTDIDARLDAWRAAGLLVDLKVYAGLHFLRDEVMRRT